jgi:hypothetical protein
LTPYPTVKDEEEKLQSLIDKVGESEAKQAQAYIDFEALKKEKGFDNLTGIDRDLASLRVKHTKLESEKNSKACSIM